MTMPNPESPAELKHTRETLEEKYRKMLKGTAEKVVQLRRLLEVEEGERDEQVCEARNLFSVAEIAQIVGLSKGRVEQISREAA